ncbi:hypothetical protein FHR81_002398 [Actinoalloteichus hoggarensis]|uniref:Uncharacterized protein n=1 Tax=Actinoalloteichus hoggarensis TaxID=1470176 RepID=A0A221W7R6_9PSEU|nr:hypothetical protein [Actinoalloteichus hoggarensis]ASO21427.1 hypothetical protein AHOG_19010 [Actinoalloteichus hoggarensis]MBB5921360.1 hypothetical protein [Actinoalloteichus hoggarensis]
MNADQRPNPMVLSTRRESESDAAADHANAIAEVEQAIRLLDGLDELATAAHVARFDAVHAALGDALSGIDRI